jgi:hypothetical protein
MNGVHDLGGMHGFRPVVREHDEPVFHAPWEGRVQVMMTLARPALFGSGRGARFAIEAVEPVRRLAASYWERWLAALELGVLARGLATREELAARVPHFAAHPEAPAASRARPGQAPLRPDRPGSAVAGGAGARGQAQVADRVGPEGPVGASAPPWGSRPALPRFR